MLGFLCLGLGMALSSMKAHQDISYKGTLSEKCQYQQPQEHIATCSYQGATGRPTLGLPESPGYKAQRQPPESAEQNWYEIYERHPGQP